MVETNFKTILALDCGTSTTIAVFIARVEGTYRLIARGEALSTHSTPWNNIILGVVDAIKLIEEKTGHRLLDDNDEPIKPQTHPDRGVDAIVVVTSTAQPLAVTLAGLMPKISLNSAKQALATTYTKLIQEIDLSKVQGAYLEEQITCLQQNQPDIILLVGGIDEGSTKPVLNLARILALALEMTHLDHQPNLIFAGNHEIRPLIADILGHLTQLKPIDNVQPTLDKANPQPAQNELDTLYIEKRMAQVPGSERLSAWGNGAMMPTSKSYTKTIQYLGQSYGVKVLGADVGSAHTTLAVKRNEFHNGFTVSDMGAGYGLKSLLDQVDSENFKRWLPFEISLKDLEVFLLQRSFFPDTVPHTYREVLLELSITREILRLVLSQARQNWPKLHDYQRWFNWDLIIGSGGALTQLPNPALSAIALIDGLEPVGIGSLALDTGSMLAILGTLAATAPQAAVHVAGYDALVNLGVIIAPVGVAYPGEAALKIKITYEDDREVQDLKIPFGTLERIPLSPGERADIEIYPTRNFDLSPLGQTPGKGVAATVQGGLLGLIVDTRGRPIILASDESERRNQASQWLLKLGLDPNYFLSETDMINLSNLVSAS